MEISKILYDSCVWVKYGHKENVMLIVGEFGPYYLCEVGGDEEVKLKRSIDIKESKPVLEYIDYIDLINKGYKGIKVKVNNSWCPLFELDFDDPFHISVSGKDGVVKKVHVRKVTDVSDYEDTPIGYFK